MYYLVLVFALIAMSTSLSAQGQTAQDICPILIGTDLPDATVRNIEGADVQVSSVTNGQPTVMIIYRGSWCPYCNKHFSKIGGIEAELKEMGYQMVAVSPDTPENLTKTIDKNDLTYTLLSDSKLDFINALGLSFLVDDKTIKRYKMYGINLEKASGEAHHRLPVPALLIIDKEGMVQFTYVNPNYKVRANPDVVLAAARAALN